MLALRMLRDADGDERLVHRSVQIYEAPLLACPRGHRLKNAGLALEEAVVTCEHRLDNGARCDLSVYVITDWVGAGGVSLTLAVQVTRDEIARLRRLRLRERLAYLGLFTGVGHAHRAG